MKKIYPEKWAYWLLSNLIPNIKMSCLFIATFLMLQTPLQAKDSLPEIKVSVNAHQRAVKKILREIEIQSGMKFIYLNNQIDEHRKVSMEISKAPLNVVLDNLFSGTDVIYQQLDRQILLKKPASKISLIRDEKNGQAVAAFTVTGKVTDENAEPLPGVNILEKGTTNGTTTDQNGDYTLIVDNPEVILVFSFIGYSSQEVKVGNQSQINVSLMPDVKSLQEVVVVGYGTQKKVNLTGAVASVTGENMTKRPVANAATMLQGAMPGVQIVQNSGEPGNEDVSIRIRGTGTFSGAGSDPLVLIDGVPGNLTNLNPINIESISVLKDAASASIYGARAANGVILVTTKMGKEGKISMEYGGNYAIHTPTKLFDLITNSAEYMEMYNEARVNSGLMSDLYTDEMINTYRNATDRNQYPNTDWLDLMFNSAPTQMHNLSFSGGGNGTTFDVSLGYVNQEGVMKGFDYERFNIRFNLGSKVNENIRFGGNLALKKGTRTAPRQGSQDTFLATMAQAPTYSPQLADGSGRYTNKAFPFEYNNKNPVAIVNNNVNRNTEDYAIQTQGWIDITLAKGLTWNTKGAINLDFSKYDDFRPIVPLYNFTTHEPMGILDVGGAGLVIRDEQNVYKNIFSYLNFEHLFGDKHEVSAKAGYSAEDNEWQYLNGYRQDYPNDDLRQLDAGSPSVQQATGTKNEWALMSFFGRIGYNYDNRYLLEANLRYDGTSRLAPDSRWGSFPSFSAGWRISEEQFIKDLGLSWLDQLKFRGSYGQLGNQNIGLYPYQSILQLTSNYSFDNASLSTGVAQTGLANRNIKWEITTAVDVGFDLTVFGGLDITFDWYKKKTSDILRSSLPINGQVIDGVGLQVPDVVGLNPPTVNKGTMENTGIELGLQYTNRITSGYFSGLNYNLGLNIDHYKNELVDFGAREIRGYSILEEGYEWDSYYMLEWIGIFQSADEIASSPKQFNDATVPGDLKFRDANNDGKVDNDDRVHISGRYPAFNYAFNFSANWKGFDLSAQLQGVENVKYFVNGWGTIPFIQGAPPTTNWRERWTDTNPSTTVPRIYWGWSAPERVSRNSSWFLQDGSYLRLKNLTVGYTLPQMWTERASISRLRIYFSGDNLLTRTKYPGLDPERGASGTFVNYPQNKIYSFGVNVTF